MPDQNETSTVGALAERELPTDVPTDLLVVETVDTCKCSESAALQEMGGADVCRKAAAVLVIN